MAWKGWEDYVPPDVRPIPVQDVPPATPKRSKYGAEPTTVDGIRFDSKRESERYSELKLLEKSGEIINLRLQPEFSLCVWRPDHSDIRTVGKYVGDFAYTVPGYRPMLDIEVVEDVKSPATRTPIYRWKIKHLRLQYGIEVKET